MTKKDTLKICIIGMPGSGKSTIGRILSKKLNYKFFDTDENIEDETKTKIAYTKKRVNLLIEELKIKKQT